MGRGKIDEVLSGLKKLSKNKGYVLNEEIDELVGDRFNPSDIIKLYDRLSDEKIDFFDSSDKARMKLEARKKRERKKAKSSEELLTAAVRYDDPVRMYLREMGKVPLLDREGEIEIAKRIEAGHIKITKAIFSLNTTTRELKRFVEKLEKGFLRLEDIVQLESGGLHPHYSGKKEQKKYTGILKKIIRYREEIVELQAKLNKKISKKNAALVTKQLQTRNKKLQEEYRKINLHPDQRERLVGKIKDILSRIDKLKKQIEESSEAAGFLASRRSEVPLAIEVLADITRILPDATCPG